MSESASLSDNLARWIGLLEPEFLRPFVMDGGACCRFVAVDDQSALDLDRGLSAVTSRRDLLTVHVDGAKVKLGQVEQIWFEVARAMDWHACRKDLAVRLLHHIGQPVPEADTFSWRLLADAAESTVERMRSRMEREAVRRYRQHAMIARDLRTALITLSLAGCDSKDSDGQDSDIVIAWLRGERPPLKALRRIGIGSQVTRATAKSLLFSIGHLLNVFLEKALVLILDARPLHFPRMQHCLFYSPAALLDAYELFRQLIDGVDRMRGTMIIVKVGPAFAAGDTKRSFEAYPALKTRLSNEVTDRRRQNMVAPFCEFVP